MLDLRAMISLTDSVLAASALAVMFKTKPNLTQSPYLLREALVGPPASNYNPPSAAP